MRCVHEERRAAEGGQVHLKDSWTICGTNIVSPARYDFLLYYDIHMTGSVAMQITDTGCMIYRGYPDVLSL